MPEKPEQDGGLSERLLSRAANVGVVDVGWAQRQYARSTDFVAERFAVLGDLNSRYGTVDGRADASSTLPLARGEYVRAEPETPARFDDHTPTGSGLESTHEANARAAGADAPANVGGGTTLQRKPKATESAPASSEKSAPLVSKESPSDSSDSSAAPTVMRLAAETPSTTGVDVNSPELTLESPRADAREESRGDTSNSDATPGAREVSFKQGASVQPTLARESVRAEESAASATTSTEQHNLPLAREEVTAASHEPALSVMRAPRVSESAPQIQRAASDEEDEDAPTKRAARA